MSDVNLAPQPSPDGSGGQAAPTAANEVPINPNPVSPPPPVDSQPPPKPPEQRRPSRLETIQEAFKKSERERPKPQPAKAEMGHNKPPEPMEEEEKFDLRRRPKDQPREKGKFVARAPAEQDGGIRPGEYGPLIQDSQPGQPGQPKRQAPPLTENAPFRAPPPRMHEAAKAEWSLVPQNVRGEVYRMAREFNDAYQRSSADVQEMEQIRRFQAMAKQHGTTLQKALTNYTGMEELLRTNLVAGLDLIVNNLKLRSPDGQQLGIRDVAYHILNQSPEQHQMLQSQNTQMAQSHQLAQANQRIAQLEQAMRQGYAQQQFVYNRSAVDQFAASHPRFDELSETIYRELATGLYSLEEAYRRADLLHPTQAVQTRTPTAQTRPADRSISGAPDGSLNGTASRTKKPVPSIHEAVTNAVKQVRGSM